MSQSITIAVGDPVVSQSIQQILKSLADPGILEGFELTVSGSNILAIQPGVALIDSGVLLIEDEVRQQTINLTVAPSNFTVYYSYVSTNTFGGNPAILTIQAGLINPATFENGVILGWIKYPGGSVPLDAPSMFISAPRFRLTSPPEKSASEYIMQYGPFSTKWTKFSSSGPVPTISEAWNPTYKAPVTTLTNAGGSLSNSKYVVPFRVPFFGVGKLQVEVQADSGSNVTVQLIDHLGNNITPIEQNFFTNAPMGKHILTIPYSPGLVPNTEMFVLFSFDMQPTFSAQVKSVGISSYSEPF